MFVSKTRQRLFFVQAFRLVLSFREKKNFTLVLALKVRFCLLFLSYNNDVFLAGKVFFNCFEPCFRLDLDVGGLHVFNLSDF